MGGFLAFLGSREQREDCAGKNTYSNVATSCARPGFACADKFHFIKLVMFRKLPQKNVAVEALLELIHFSGPREKLGEFLDRQTSWKRPFMETVQIPHNLNRTDPGAIQDYRIKSPQTNSDRIEWRLDLSKNLTMENPELLEREQIGQTVFRPLNGLGGRAFMSEVIAEDAPGDNPFSGYSGDLPLVSRKRPKRSSWRLRFDISCWTCK